MNNKKLSLIFAVSLTTINSMYSTDLKFNGLFSYVNKDAIKNGFEMAKATTGSYATKDAMKNGFEMAKAALAASATDENKRNGKIVLGVTAGLVTIAGIQRLYNYLEDQIVETPDVVSAAVVDTAEQTSAAPVIAQAPEIAETLKPVVAPRQATNPVVKPAVVVKQAQASIAKPAVVETVVARIAPVIKQAQAPVAKPTVNEIVKNNSGNPSEMMKVLKAHGYTRAHVSNETLKQLGKLNDGQMKFFSKNLK